MKAVNFFLAFLFITVLLVVGCASPRATERGVQGGALGAGLGAIFGGGRGAVAGALIGTAVGSIIGTAESDTRPVGRYASGSTTPLRWLEGAKVEVKMESWGWYSSLRGIVEDGLRGRGAIIISPGRYAAMERKKTLDYVAEARIERHGSDVVAEIKIIGSGNVIQAIGHGRSQIFYGYYGYSNEYDSYVVATRQALARLH